MPEERDVDSTGRDRAGPREENIDPTLPGVDDTILFESPVYIKRLIRLSSRCEIVCDSLPEDGMEIRCLRWTPIDRDASASFGLASESSGFVSDDRMGTLITGGPDGTAPVLWLPKGVVTGRSDSFGRLKVVNGPEIETWWELEDVPKFHLRASGADGLTVYVPMIAFDEGVSVTRADIFDLKDFELQRFFKSDWFVASSPADLWKYYVDGGVFDPRDGGPGRFRCQQCAYAWWAYLLSLHRRTGKPHYRSLARAVAWSVCADLGRDGCWRHGFWNDDPEIHSRMFWDGIRVLISEHEESPHARLLDAAATAADFAVQQLSEELDGDRLWFLHDSDEGSKPLRVRSAVLGRSKQNSLCLNTHVQALAVLVRLRRVADDRESLSEAYSKGVAALRAVLELRCDSRPLKFIDRSLPLLLAWKIPRNLGERVLRFIAIRILGRGYWWARKRSSCLVFPSGYIDRDLGRTMLADEYHVVNLKDLVELVRLDPQPWLEEIIVRGTHFIASLDFERALERNPIWAEWADVFTISKPPHAVDPAHVEATIGSILGGRPLDSFCAASGVWRFEEGG
jgi:hypothetical protein